MNKWKIAAWISWGVIILVVLLGIILYLPGRVKVIENAEKIDNLTWQYQFVSVLYEQSQIESELYKMSMIGCYNLRQEYRDYQQRVDSLFVNNFPVTFTDGIHTGFRLIRRNRCKSDKGRTICPRLLQVVLRDLVGTAKIAACILHEVPMKLQNEIVRSGMYS